MRLFNAEVKNLALSMTMVGLVVLFTSAPALAACKGDNGDQEVKVHKSYVCKYVGKPGVDERLQTGNNPIWVDNHSLTGKNNTDVKVGDTFSDAQVKSVVIVANTEKLNPEPTVSACPAAQGPTTPVTPVTPPVVGRGGQVLGDNTTVVTVKPAAATLPNTGVSTLTTSILSLLILATTAGIVSYRPKHVA